MTTIPRHPDLRHSLPQAKRTVRVVRDPRDAAKDYFIPEVRAEGLYARGELSLREVRGGRFEFASPEGREVR